MRFITFLHKRCAECYISTHSDSESVTFLHTLIADLLDLPLLLVIFQIILQLLTIIVAIGDI